MAERIRAFVFEQDWPIREVDQDGLPWFFLEDICRACGLGSTSMVKARLDRDCWKYLSVVEVKRGNPRRIIVTETGMYQAVLGAERYDAARNPRKLKPEQVEGRERAKRFRRWVTAEVLPEIGRTGHYLGRGEEQPSLPLPPPPQLPPQDLPPQGPDWVTCDIGRKVGLMREYRKTFGVAGAQWMAQQMGLPIPPTMRQPDLLTPDDAIGIWIRPPGGRPAH